MMDDEDPNEALLRFRQAAELDGIGRSLRSTFSADNHETIGEGLTRLMLELSQEFPARPASPNTGEPVRRPSLWTRLRRGRRSGGGGRQATS